MATENTADQTAQKSVFDMTDDELEAVHYQDFQDDGEQQDVGDEELGEIDEASESDEAAQPDEQGDTDSSDAPDAAPEPAKEEAPAKVDGVMTKDGKHVMPFKVVEDLRTSESALKQKLAQMQEQMKAMQAQAAGGAKAPDMAEIEMLSNEQIEALEEEGLGSLAKTFRAQQEAMKGLFSKVQALEVDKQQAAKQRETSLRGEVQSAIDSVPKLALIQQTDAEAFEVMKQLDVSQYNASAKWREMPLAERFAKVVKMYEASYGEIQIDTVASDDTQTAEKPVAKTAAAKKTPAKPALTTLSDLPGGGSAPPVDLRARLLSMTETQRLAWMQDASGDELEQVFDLF